MHAYLKETFTERTQHDNDEDREGAEDRHRNQAFRVRKKKKREKMGCKRLHSPKPELHSGAGKGKE